MLTRTAAAVKFDLPSTPEQKACSMHLGEGLKTFWSLVEHLQHAADEHQPMHQVEEVIFRELLVVGRWLLHAFLDLAGPGDVGPTLTVAGDSAANQDQELPRLDRPRKRPYLSIFGEIAIERICYGHDRVEAAPLGCPTPPLAAAVFVLAPAEAGSVCGRRRSCRGDSEAGDDPEFGHHCQGVGGSQL